MKKEIKLSYLKKAKKFLDKNKSVLNESQVDELVIKFIKNIFIIRMKTLIINSFKGI